MSNVVNIAIVVRGNFPSLFLYAVHTILEDIVQATRKKYDCSPRPFLCSLKTNLFNVSNRNSLKNEKCSSETTETQAKMSSQE